MNAKKSTCFASAGYADHAGGPGLTLLQQLTDGAAKKANFDDNPSAKMGGKHAYIDGKGMATARRHS